MQRGIFDFVQFPPGLPKPREAGMTLLIDRCLPTPFMESFVQLNSDIIDYIKVADHAGMFTRYSPEWTRDRLKMYDRYAIGSLPSGFAFELAYAEGKAYQFFDAAKKLGFSAAEISEGLIPEIPLKEREKLIRYAKEIGLIVFTEIGRKFATEPLDFRKTVETIQEDLAWGAKKVTIEKDEIVICKRDGSKTLHRIVEEVGPKNVFLECGPGGWPDVHQWLIENFGPEANLENIEFDELVRVEAARRGMDRIVGFSALSKRYAP